ncbi:MAG: flagellar basal-body rod protein FlgG [Pseudomonadota bacterium]
MRALQIAATGMEAQQTRVETISNNIANMSTTAYKARRAEFADLHYQQAEAPGSISSTSGTVLPTGVQLGLGVRTQAIHMSEEQGSLEQTGSQLDVAIEGRGWFSVQLPNGDTAYTRDGAFSLSNEGLLVNSDGFQIDNGITIPNDARAVSISPDGQVSGTFAGEAEPRVLGNLTLSMFPNEKGLEALGSNLFAQTAASGDPVQDDPGEDNFGVLRQGYLEASTVDVVGEITDLIEAQRGYEMNSKIVTAADQMLGATVQIR